MALMTATISLAAALQGPAALATGGDAVGFAGVSRSACQTVSTVAAANAAIKSSAPGATICFAAGTYRLRRPLYPKPGMTLIGKGRVRLLGSFSVNGFKRRGRLWVAEQPRRSPGKGQGRCWDDELESCLFRDTVYWDGRPLTRVDKVEDVHSGQVAVDPSGQIFVGEDPRGHVIEQATTSTAIRGDRPGPTASVDDVLIRNMKVLRFANPARTGAIDSDEGAGWRVTDSEIAWNAGAGLCTGSASAVVSNWIHHNGQLGLCGHGSSIEVRSNEISYNNWARFHWNWSGGGAKWVYARDLSVSDNYVHHNFGPGLWSDIDSVDVLFSRNEINNNAGPGILHEISYAATIEGNILSGNGFDHPYKDWLLGSAIQVNTSQDVVVRDNLLVGNANGIGLVEMARGAGRYGTYILDQVTVEDNDVLMTSGASGVVSNTKDPALFDRSLNFDRNTYRIESGCACFWWKGSRKTFEEWKAAGKDRSGSIVPF